MTGVAEVRAGLELSQEKAHEALAALQQAEHALDEARQTLITATEGSSQEEIQHAQGTLTEASNGISDIQGAINGASSSLDAYKARL